MWQAIERLLLAFWIGSLWTTGYIVAPVLFKQLNRATAGNVAGELFTIVSYIGIGVVAILLMSAFFKAGVRSLRQWGNRILLVMLILVLIGQFVFQPMMADLKAAGLQGARAKEFATLHGIASILYLINSVLGLVLVAWGNRKR